MWAGLAFWNVSGTGTVSPPVVSPALGAVSWPPAQLDHDPFGTCFHACCHGIGRLGRDSGPHNKVFQPLVGLSRVSQVCLGHPTFHPWHEGQPKCACRGRSMAWWSPAAVRHSSPELLPAVPPQWLPSPAERTGYPGQQWRQGCPQPVPIFPLCQPLLPPACLPQGTEGATTSSPAPVLLPSGRTASAVAHPAARPQHQWQVQTRKRP